jgi:hypothetical protein
MEQTLRCLCEQIEDLYKNVEKWLETTSLQTTREEIEIHEEAFGAYGVPVLIMRNGADRLVAKMVLVGAHVIGAQGRVNLKGRHDDEILLFLNDGGPTIESVLEDGGSGKAIKTQLYKGVEESGWYWIEDKRRGKAHKVSRELFFELLGSVSDYVLQ